MSSILVQMGEIPSAVMRFAAKPCVAAATRARIGSNSSQYPVFVQFVSPRFACLGRHDHSLPGTDGCCLPWSVALLVLRAMEPSSPASVLFRLAAKVRARAVPEF